MRVLVLTAKTIWPLLGGAEIRNFSLLKETSKHHDVYLLSFDNSHDYIKVTKNDTLIIQKHERPATIYTWAPVTHPSHGF